jgi:hypothetical protein
MDKDDFIRKLEEQFKAAAAHSKEPHQPEVDQDVKTPDFADRVADVTEVFVRLRSRLSMVTGLGSV